MTSRKKPDDIVVLRAVSMAVRQHRERTGLNQSQLAERIGVSQGNVSRWESGNGIPRGDALMRLARELNVSPQALVGLGNAPVAETVPVSVSYRIGPGEPSQASLRVPASVFTEASRGDLLGVEITDDSADARFPTGSVLICERWGGEPYHRALAVVAPSPIDTLDGPLLVASASVTNTHGAVRWWSLRAGPGRDGPLPTGHGEVWTPVFRPVAAIIPVSPID